MATKIFSATLDGTNSRVIQIECGFSRGFAGILLIGNATEVSRAGKERAKVALEYLGYHLPPQKIVISLVPGDIKMDGNQYDLGIAVGLALLTKCQPPIARLPEWLFAAELSLSGQLRPVKGIVPFALAAISKQLNGIVVASANLRELSAISQCSTGKYRDFQILGFEHLNEVLNWLFNNADLGKKVQPLTDQSHDNPDPYSLNFDDMILNEELEKVAVASCSGMHSVLLRGCPGAGKSMFAARLASILPNMQASEHLECLKIQSSHFERIPSSIIKGIPPMRSPHHGASSAALMGASDHPGELSLAHGGILFLDELPEFRRDLIEGLREPLEIGQVRLARANKKFSWPCKVILIAACNNCPCGWRGSSKRHCHCSQQKIDSYRQKLSGPILDRIDIHILMPEPAKNSSDVFLQLQQNPTESLTQKLAKKVLATREFSLKRNRQFKIEFNGDLKTTHILPASGLEPSHFSEIVNRYIPKSTSNRAVIRAIRVARTLADIDLSKTLEPIHLQTAWQWQADAVAIRLGDEIEEI